MLEEVTKELEQFYLDNPVKVFVPSLQTEFNFKSISVGQQKKLIDLEKDDEDISMPDVVETPKIFNSLIRYNCLDDSLYDRVTVVDRPAILLQLKYSTKGNIDLIIDSSLYNVNLKPFVNNLKHKKPKVKFRKTVTAGKFLVHLHVPTLTKDEAYNDFFLGNVDEGGDVTGSAILAECAKFIEKVELESKVFDFTDSEALVDNMQLLNSLPSSVIAKVADYVSAVKEYQILLVTERISLGKETKTIFLDIDVPFFTTM